MAYTTIDDSGLFFNTLTTTGTGNAQAVTGLGFQPDWIWGKRTDGTGHHSLFDSVRGITKGLETIINVETMLWHSYRICEALFSQERLANLT